MSSIDALNAFSPVTRRWFEDSFAAPTPAQVGAWEAISSGKHALVVAPTGSGKTLAAFLWSLDRLARAPQPPPGERLRVVYLSPLKALAADIERNLRSPLTGMSNVASRTGASISPISVGIRTGDTPAGERRRFSSHPPDILITTPESLFLLLTSASREALRFVDTVIVDEVHALVDSKRGAHLALSLERLEVLVQQRHAQGPPAGKTASSSRSGDSQDRPIQRIGLSATVRPVKEVADFLGGGRPVRAVQPRSQKEFELSVEVPVEDMSELGEALEEAPVGRSAAWEAQRKSIWPSVEQRLADLIRAHRSTIIFTNSRRLAERLCARLNELAGEEIARSHHGSVSKEQRRLIEEELKAGRLPAVVATSSLELGIDMGAVDLVVQVEAPVSVASGLQRVGRAGHGVGEVSRGIFFPKFRGDLLQMAVVVERMKAGEIEHLRFPRNPLDVLAQQIVAMVAMEDWYVEDLRAVVCRAAPFSGLPPASLHAVLDMLSGLYPSDAFADLRPRINWDRDSGRLSARRNAQHLAVTSGGTIPDRGLFGVFLAGAGSGARVGELDEEMVYESRVTEVFALGASSWRIEEITHDRVLVTPAPGEPAKMPFWKGDTQGRPYELGRAVGRFIRELDETGPAAAGQRLRQSGLDEPAVWNLLKYLDDQRRATGRLPDDRTLLVEKFRDELGDWRVCLHSPFGARVHAPWALAIQARAAEKLGLEVQTMHTDDGIVIRFPGGLWEDDRDSPEAGVGIAGPEDLAFFDPGEVDALVRDAVGGSALFAGRFRECAARALLLPKRRPDRRTPLWQQRQKSADLLQIASQYGSFPVVLETMRECLQDVFDLPGLKDLMQSIESGKLRVLHVETPVASPFASSLLFGYVGTFLYEGDAPLAERRAQALSVDTAMLADLLGDAELRELLDPDVLVQTELELQRLAEDRKFRDLDDVHDFLRRAGAMSSGDLRARGAQASWLAELEERRRAIRLRIAGEERWAAIEDAGRYRDALGVPLSPGIPHAYLEAVEDPVGDLAARYARSHGPFEARHAAEHLGLGIAVVTQALVRLRTAGKVVEGEFRPSATRSEPAVHVTGTQWCDAEVLRTLRRRSLARLRKEVEAVPGEVLGRFLPEWHGMSNPARGRDGLLRAIEQLQGSRLPAGALERLILPGRVSGYSPAMLDELCAAGHVIWTGSGRIGRDDGWVSLYLASDAELLLAPPGPAQTTESGNRVLSALSGEGALFFRQLLARTQIATDTELLEALWDLVWEGLITNDTLAPLRAFVSGRGKADSRQKTWTPARSRRRPRLPAAQPPAAGAGRWSLVPVPTPDGTRRMHAIGEQLLDRHGVLTRGAAMSEHIPGGFAGIYAVLKAFEEQGACRRGYFVEGLGAAQFAVAGAVDRLRSIAAPPSPNDGAGTPSARVLAAADPANPYGAALPWPDPPADQVGRGRPARKAGALVVLVEGSPAVYVERGGKSLLTFTDDPARLEPAMDAVALAVREGSLGRLAVERADGAFVLDTPVAKAMEAAGFRQTPKGLRLRG